MSIRNHLTRVVFGVNASPFILNATIRHHVNTCMLNDNSFALELLKSLYMDDFVSGAKDVNNAFSLSKEIELCLKSGRFSTRKWNSNSASLLQSLKQDQPSVETLLQIVNNVFKRKMRASQSQFLSKVLRKSRRSWECFGALTKMN